ncbi:general transcriptional corepressor trfA-like [Diorhabda sublineata]|uniref:general transcriptional corepressor trfA-like n=1 Tax=Diorhabda sublineata TaxID=1163346 RepID=UPI0024E0C8F8|nr:general transcriptional corepressor trfA-like [Diorhabda sublineata]
MQNTEKINSNILNLHSAVETNADMLRMHNIGESEAVILNPEKGKTDVLNIQNTEENNVNKLNIQNTKGIYANMQYTEGIDKNMQDTGGNVNMQNTEENNMNKQNDNTSCDSLLNFSQVTQCLYSERIDKDVFKRKDTEGSNANFQNTEESNRNNMLNKHDEKAEMENLEESDANIQYMEGSNVDILNVQNTEGNANFKDIKESSGIMPNTGGGNTNMRDTGKNDVNMQNIKGSYGNMLNKEESDKYMRESKEDTSWDPRSSFLQEVSQFVYTKESDKDMNEQNEGINCDSWSSLLKEVSQFVCVVNSSCNNIKFEAPLEKNIEQTEETETKNVNTFYVGEIDSTKLLVDIKITADEVIPLLSEFFSKKEFNQEDFDIQPLENFLKQLKCTRISNTDSNSIDSFLFGIKKLCEPTEGIDVY